MRDIPDKSIDMILCDLPYGTTRNKWDAVIPFESLWKQYKRIIKDNGVIALFADEPFSATLITSNLKDYRYEWIWQKEQGTDFLNANRKPLKVHEKIQIFININQPITNSWRKENHIEQLMAEKNQQIVMVNSRWVILSQWGTNETQ